MENRPPISAPILSQEIFHFAQGYPDTSSATPTHIAWSLENAALRDGWPVGASLGSETALIAGFGVSRERLREAIRIVEARGAMRMERGRRGGLRLLDPDVDRAADALASYLRITGYSTAALRRSQARTAELFATLPADGFFAQLYGRTVARLLRTEAEADDPAARGSRIAIQLAARLTAPIPAEGHAIGSEAALCERFNASRTIVRQALRILDDAGMLVVRRGRGGGYSLRSPTPIGTIRRVFVPLAARKPALDEIVAVIWALNRARLRLALDTLARSDADWRVDLCDRLAVILDRASEPRRWATVQGEIGIVADDALTATLIQCFLAWLARIGPAPGDHSRLDAELRRIETAIVAAIATNNVQAAERHQCAAHACLGALMGVQDSILPVSTFR